jgi:hypothetical protein
MNIDDDVPSLLAEVHLSGSSPFGGAVHPLVPPEMAPPGLAAGLRTFLSDHPLEGNIFGMTRFPLEEADLDPIRDALDIARTTAKLHGLEFHLASDRAIMDDLWTNVCAHMWAAKFGIAFFENRHDSGINVNMSIEVGAMLMTGRRCALLRDTSIEKMPADLVGQIYKPVDLEDLDSVEHALHIWLRDDLRFARCKSCPND